MSRDDDEINLTAYALGELEGPECQAIEARLKINPDDRRMVEEIRAMAHVVSGELAREPQSSLDAIHLAAIELRFGDHAGLNRYRDNREIVRARIGFAVTLAASVAIVCGTFAALFLLMPNKTPAPTKIATSQPASHPILIPLNPQDLGSGSQGVAFVAPASSDDPFVSVERLATSRFSLNPDVDSYDELRKSLFEDRLPSRRAVKIDGLVNAFDYEYPEPTGNAVFAGQIEIGQCPWAPGHRLARVQLKAKPGDGVVAQNVQAEVTFNKSAVQSWRLLADENSAGGAGTGENVSGGHAVTALYEVVPAKKHDESGEMLSLNVQFRRPDSSQMQSASFLGQDSDERVSSDDFRFAAAVAEFGMVMQNSEGRGNASIDSVIQLADSARGVDAMHQRAKFIDLVGRAKELLS